MGDGVLIICVHGACAIGLYWTWLIMKWTFQKQFAGEWHNRMAFVWSLPNAGLACVCLVVFVHSFLLHTESQAILLFFNRSTRVVLRYFSYGLSYISFRSADFYGIETKQRNHTTPRAERYLLCANFSIFTLAHARTRTHTSTWTVHNSEPLARSFCDSLRVSAPYSVYTLCATEVAMDCHALEIETLQTLTLEQPTAPTTNGDGHEIVLLDHQPATQRSVPAHFLGKFIWMKCYFSAFELGECWTENQWAQHDLMVAINVCGYCYQSKLYWDNVWMHHIHSYARTLAYKRRLLMYLNCVTTAPLFHEFTGT